MKFETQLVKARLLTDGGYDGMKGVKFPVEVEAVLFDNLRYIEVPMSELLRIGYDTVAGGLGGIPDQADMSEPLPFMISWGEAEVIE